MTPLETLRSLFAPVLAKIVDGPIDAYVEMVKPSGDAKNGDYQANFAMPLAKTLGKKPPELASEIVAGLGGQDVCTATVAGPGFINLKLTDRFLAERIATVAADERMGVPTATPTKSYVIDLSGPNVAKPLHVGHLRSTIIGDSLVRLLRFLGHSVVGDNHLGDWGTQFGILIYGYKHHLDRAAYDADPVRELARLYVHVRNLAKVTGDEDDAGTNEVMDACRKETAKLHAGDAENRALWDQFMPACLAMLTPIYDRLGVHIDHALGESFYNPMLPGVVDDLLAKGIAVESHGAVVVPNAKGIVPTPEQMDKEEPPALVRKRDGAFTYTTTDLATIKHRIETWTPDAMLYCVDARQALHFRTLFANAKRWGYDCDYRHVSFGSIIGPDRRPLRTRDGGVPELMDLLDEAVAVAGRKYRQSLDERRASGREAPDLTPEEERTIAEVVGIGAVKYADLSSNRTSDYVFDLDRMLATEGNTATYMQYAYARCRSILRRAGADDDAAAVAVPTLREPAERALAVQLVRFPEALSAATTDFYPHVIAAYLWDLTKAFSTFFEACPVLKAESETAKADRLMLVRLVGRTIRQALDLLGIQVVERM
jgi:arginyl-tRNA synthetase